MPEQLLVSAPGPQELLEVAVQGPPGPPGGVPVTVLGAATEGATLAAAVADGWSGTGLVWVRLVGGIATTVGTSTTYTVQAADVAPGARLGVRLVDAVFTALADTDGAPGPGPSTTTWDDAAAWNDLTLWIEPP